MTPNYLRPARDKNGKEACLLRAADKFSPGTSVLTRRVKCETRFVRKISHILKVISSQTSYMLIRNAEFQLFIAFCCTFWTHPDTRGKIKTKTEIPLLCYDHLDTSIFLVSCLLLFKDIKRKDKKNTRRYEEVPVRNSKEGTNERQVSSGKTEKGHQGIQSYSQEQSKGRPETVSESVARHDGKGTTKCQK